MEQKTENKYGFDSVTPAPGPRKPLKDGIAVGTPRFDYVSPPEYCGCPVPHKESRLYGPYNVWYIVCLKCGNEVKTG